MTWSLSRLCRAFVAVTAFALILVINVAATGDAASIANALAGVAIILSPLALRYVKLDGPTMVAVSYVLAFAIAAAALMLSGQAKFDASSVGSVLAFATAAFGVQQLVFQAFKDSTTVGPLLK